MRTLEIFAPPYLTSERIIARLMSALKYQCPVGLKSKSASAADPTLV